MCNFPARRRYASALRLYYDYRMPGKKDDVSFAVTRLDMERGVAVGIITRIIRQNL